MIYDKNSPQIMGILNVTDDSFFDKSRYLSLKLLIAKAEEMILQGVSILDVGACSTRPDSTPVSTKEELSRLNAVMPTLRKQFPNVKISIDTFRAEVAKIAVNQWGVDCVNDVYGGTKDPLMISLISELKVPYVLTHSFESNLYGKELLNEIFTYFASNLERLYSIGVDNVIVDLGFGFGKDMIQNFQLLSAIDYFKTLNCPILVGLSRKRMVWQTLGISPNDALNGTSVLNTIALLNGADIIRVHDVLEAKQVVDLVSKYKEIIK